MKVSPYFPPGGTARIAFVGEGPTDDDLIKRQPLVGADGRVFNGMLRSAGLDRDDMFLTNVFNEQPDGSDDFKPFLQDPTYMAEAYARLNAELLRAQVSVIVPLGDTALQAFTGQRAIKNFRGAVTKATQTLPGAKLVPTFHPETVRKQWHLLPVVVGDFIKADAEADIGPEITYPKVEILIEPTIRDIRDFVPLALASPKLSVDIETGWGQITSIAFAPDTEHAMSIPFVDLRRPGKSYWVNAEQEFAAWRMVQEMCEAPNPKVGQNFMYDLFWLYQRHGIEVRNYRYDTRIRHKVLFPELAADLANMSASYTRVGAYKGWGGRYQKATEKKDG